MPISPIVIQRRHAELGRIRLGQKGDRGQPQKLGAFRFTSPSERYIKDLAELYGGTPQPWDNGGKPEFEVFTTATTIPVIAVKGGLSQWMETWSGGGCVHRCDGERMVTGDLCEYDTTTVTIRERGKPDRVVPAHDVAKPTTRLSVMLPELEALGVWRMESHGWNAAAEIPAVAELAAYVGDLVPANLNLVERRAIKDGKTSRFVVPILDLQIGAARLRELAEAMSSGRELGPAAAAPAAIEAATSHDDEGPDWPAYHQRVEAATSLEELTDLWNELVYAELVGQAAAEEGRITPDASHFTEAFRARAKVLKDRQGGGTATAESAGGQGGSAAASGGAPSHGGNQGEGAAADLNPAAASSPAPDADGVVDGELVDDPDPEGVWAEIVRVAGELGMTLPDVQDDVATYLGGTTAGEASGAELQAFLDDNLLPRLTKAAS